MPLATQHTLAHAPHEKQALYWFCNLTLGCWFVQAQAALSMQLVVARQQHADVCMQLQKEHAASQQAALQEHALQKVGQASS